MSRRTQPLSSLFFHVWTILDSDDLLWHKMVSFRYFSPSRCGTCASTLYFSYLCLQRMHLWLVPTLGLSSRTIKLPIFFEFNYFLSFYLFFSWSTSSTIYFPLVALSPFLSKARGPRLGLLRHKRWIWTFLSTPFPGSRALPTQPFFSQLSEFPVPGSSFAFSSNVTKSDLPWSLPRVHGSWPNFKIFESVHVHCSLFTVQIHMIKGSKTQRLREFPGPRI